MDEQRKYAILFAATILAARKLIDMDPNKPNMAKGFFVDRTIEDKGNLVYGAVDEKLLGEIRFVRLNRFNQRLRIAG